MDNYKEKRAQLLEDKFDEQKKVPQRWFTGILWVLVAFVYLFAIALIILFAVVFNIKL